MRVCGTIKLQNKHREFEMIGNKKKFEQVFLGPKWGYNRNQLTSAVTPGYLHVTHVEATFKQKGWNFTFDNNKQQFM